MIIYFVRISVSIVGTTVFSDNIKPRVALNTVGRNLFYSILHARRTLTLNLSFNLESRNVFIFDYLSLRLFLYAIGWVYKCFNIYVEYSLFYVLLPGNKKYLIFMS